VRLALALRRETKRLARATGRRVLDFDELFTLHHAFHARLIDASGSGPRIRTLLDTVHVQLDRYEWAYAPLVAPNFAPTIREHLAIARAVQSGTPSAIERAVRANWFAGARRITRAIGDARDNDPDMRAYPPGRGR
jgi:DNA-binding GntR family transcriptional regulator